ncbi:CAP domain-containing protein [Desulfofundulus thermocisternus]|uniref:CAP domain-containing protein n=1 Tax=Desulfofundulus thermocisternus TaxID=42471 RepID=UPI00217D522D|nr:CAP domain-containing protein [Desulfofundulus thermocisternus]MCS5696829.1 CAP domain-containing protein [Desulfofundulus thermocisternus]
MNKKLKSLVAVVVSVVLLGGLFTFPALAAASSYSSYLDCGSGQKVPAYVLNPTAEEQRMMSLINQQRSSKGLPSLKIDPRLVALARQRAGQIVDRGLSGYQGSLSQLLKDKGISYTCAAQTLVRATSVDSACQALQKSPAYQKDVLGTRYDRIGVGVARSSSWLYIVQLLVGGEGKSLSGQPAPQPAPQPVPNPPAPRPAPRPEPPAGSVSGLTVDEQQMIQLINQERARYGLAPLKVNMELVKVARLKARDMVEKGYFSHNSPTYGSPFEMMSQFGITYRYAGENLAGAPTVEMAHNNLMNSPGHRANILNANYKEIGIGVVSSPLYGKIFVQMFTG